MQYCTYTISLISLTFTAHPQPKTRNDLFSDRQNRPDPLNHLHALIIPRGPLEPLFNFIPNHRISIILKQPPFQERRDVVNLQIFRSGFQLFDGNSDGFGVFASLMAVELDFFFDDLTEEERDKFFVICGLVDVFSEALVC